MAETNTDGSASTTGSGPDRRHRRDRGTGKPTEAGGTMPEAEGTLPEGERRVPDPPTLGLAAAALSLALAACADGAGGSDYNARMAREHRADEPVASAATTPEPRQEVTARRVVYGRVEDREIRGYLARPSGSPDTLPGLIVIHEWWGLNDNIRSMTRRLAGQGYAALAVDLYGGQVATTPARAGELARSVDGEQARDNLRQAYRWLVERGAPRVGSIGWCFGGGWSLRTALMLPEELDAAVIYYGRLTADPDRLRSLSMPIQGHFGADDGSIPVSEVRRFETVLDSLGKEAEIHVYQDAGHAFANPSGTRYVEAAAERAWERTTRFLAAALSP